MQYLLILIINILIIQSCGFQETPILKIGLVADPQYADQEVRNNRFYRESLWKLQEAIDNFNDNHIDFVQNLGDIIDDDWESYNAIIPIYNNLNPEIENYQLLGNHDFSIDSTHLNNLLERLSMPDYYYSYTREGWRFIVLDATDYSHYSNLLHHHDTSKVNFYFNSTRDKPNHHLWNGAMGEEQQDWLRQELKSAKVLDQKVILFSHLPIRPQGDAHNLWNDDEIAEIIENSPNVVAFINGHNHSGGYEFKNGIHYITIFGMVDTKISSYGILEIYNDDLVLKGFGHQKTYHLNIE